jgi:hypothetical protein
MSARGGARVVCLSFAALFSTLLLLRVTKQTNFIVLRQNFYWLFAYVFFEIGFQHSERNLMKV